MQARGQGFDPPQLHDGRPDIGRSDAEKTAIRNPNFEITCSLTIEKKQQVTALVAVAPLAPRASVLKLVAQEPKTKAIL